MFKRSLAPALLLSTAVFAPLATFAQDTTPNKWGAHIDLEGKLGDDRDIGEVDLFIPLSQDDDTLLFSTLRGRIDNQDSEEGNFGLGLRQMMSNGWNIGGYGYFDRRNTGFDNSFNQITLGAEALSETFDLRANVYMPISDKTKSAPGAGSADFAGAGISVRPGQEKALKGFDAEIGWRAPVFDLEGNKHLRLYAGGYHFYTSGVEDVTGPRARAELVFTEIKQLWSGSRLSLNAEFQHDDPRGSQGFISARLRIPLQKESRNLAKLSYMEQRMVDPIVRDVDIVSQAGAFGAAETVTQTADGKTLTVIDNGTVTGATLATEVTNAGDNAAIILNGNYTGINDHIVVRQGQSIYGGATVAVKLADGSTEYIKTPSATLSGTGGNGSMGGPRRILQMADNSRLEGATLNLTNTASSTGVYINEVDNAKVINNTINVESTTATASGIQLSSGAFADRPMNTEIRNNQISTTASSAGSYSRSIVLIHNENTIISGNQITSEALSGSTREDLIFINGDTVNISGSGNSGNISSCRHASGTITGSVGFTTATDNDCP